MKWVLTNVTLWTIVVAVIQGYCKQDAAYNRSALILKYLFLWFTGMAFLWSGLMHLLFANFTAAKIGWQPSPFQFEVGLANLSMTALGFIAYKTKSRYFWLGTIISSAIFLIGAGAGHIYQALILDDHAVANSGTILYTDIFGPIIMFTLWWYAKVTASDSSSS